MAQQHQAPGPDRQAPQPELAAQAPGPFNDPVANRYFAAVMAGDSDLVDRIALEFAQSPEGQQLARLGDQLLAKQQALEQQQLQERQTAPRGPVMRM